MRFHEAMGSVLHSVGFSQENYPKKKSLFLSHFIFSQALCLSWFQYCVPFLGFCLLPDVY